MSHIRPSTDLNRRLHPQTLPSGGLVGSSGETQRAHIVPHPLCISAVRSSSFLNVATPTSPTLPSTLNRSEPSCAQIPAVKRKAESQDPTAASIDSEAARRPAPAQRILAQASVCNPALVETELVYDATCRLINVIWPKHSTSVHTQLCSLRHFVKETHTRSRLPQQILKLALFLLYRALSAYQRKQQEQLKNGISTQAIPPTAASFQPPALVGGIPMKNTLSTPPASPETYRSRPLPAEALPKSTHQGAESLPTPAATPASMGLSDSEQASLAVAAVNALNTTGSAQSSPVLSAQASFNGKPLDTPTSAGGATATGGSVPEMGGCDSSAQQSPAAANRKDPSRCGRRMYLAALMAASKFFLDKTYSNKAWSKISTLKISEVNHLEIAFLHLVNFDIYIDPLIFDRWSFLLTHHLRLIHVNDPAMAPRKALTNSILFSFTMMNRTHFEILVSYQMQQHKLAKELAARQTASPYPNQSASVNQGIGGGQTTAVPTAAAGSLPSAMVSNFLTACHPATSERFSQPSAATTTGLTSLCHYFHDYIRCVSSLFCTVTGPYRSSATAPTNPMVARSTGWAATTVALTAGTAAPGLATAPIHP
ncbi:hypothetical protein BJ085DRAFT_40792 [Dimargaris cristalligena]|uniref:Cyclin-domain-containing protein n=1 Tax=Dimargaris cristalligena TaxID=215637 RepID=A0A4V1J593_9FUNG|nr:hypothetical protein BJ085DRAFT_40792 [Dimargaris cristalligena]|eukprot:RKP38259.1 hypothetical protein BJ085DRAFT_40792 [Dimargaris cristalligena]